MFQLANRILLAGFVCFSGLASAGQSIDFVAQSITFQKGLDDDVSGSYSQHVILKIKNVGDLPSRYPGSQMRILFNGAHHNASVYGSNGVGGYNLNAPVAPGAVGLVMLYLPLNTLRNCQKIRLQLDTAQRYQRGPNVFANDAVTLMAIDPSSIRVCVRDTSHGGLSLDHEYAADIDGVDSEIEGAE